MPMSSSGIRQRDTDDTNNLKKVKKQPLSVCLCKTQLVRCDILTAFLLGIQVFWTVKYCQVSSSQHFKGTTSPNDKVQSVSLQQPQQMAVWLLTALYNHGPHSPVEVWIILGLQMPQLVFLRLRISKLLQ
jgi:hypothetical protein